MLGRLHSLAQQRGKLAIDPPAPSNCQAAPRDSSDCTQDHTMWTPGHMGSHAAPTTREPGPPQQSPTPASSYASRLTTFSSAPDGGPPLHGAPPQYFTSHQPRHVFHVHCNQQPCFPSCTGYFPQPWDFHHYHLPNQPCCHSCHSCPRPVTNPFLPPPVYQYVQASPQHHQLPRTYAQTQTQAYSTTPPPRHTTAPHPNVELNPPSTAILRAMGAEIAQGFKHELGQSFPRPQRGSSTANITTTSLARHTVPSPDSAEQQHDGGVDANASDGEEGEGASANSLFFGGGGDASNSF